MAIGPSDRLSCMSGILRENFKSGGQRTNKCHVLSDPRILSSSTPGSFVAPPTTSGSLDGPRDAIGSDTAFIPASRNSGLTQNPTLPSHSFASFASLTSSSTSDGHSKSGSAIASTRNMARSSACDGVVSEVLDKGALLPGALQPQQPTAPPLRARLPEGQDEPSACVLEPVELNVKLWC
ncbi:hypothetical protein JB92DRAFT_3109388 [Gautieria morchelliformis]|nr:hypothetical protein JB92DRAFT_3109388 [Gautieria morchelliformis]